MSVAAVGAGHPDAVARVAEIRAMIGSLNGAPPAGGGFDAALAAHVRRGRGTRTPSGPVGSGEAA